MSKDKDTKNAAMFEFPSVIPGKGTNVLSLNLDPRLEVRVPTGLDFIDELLGAGEQELGATPSTSILFTGGAGAGKTTLSQQLADAWTRAGGVALLNGQEEHPLQVRKTSKRLNLKSGFIIGEDRLVPNMLNHADYLREKSPNKPLLLICDSLQTHDDGFYRDGGTNTMTPVRITRMLTEYCKRHYAVCVLIGQVNKDGKFSGKNSIKHLVDVHMHLQIDQKPTSETFGKRILKVEKNRFGFSQVGYFLGMKSEGLYADGEWSPVVED
mgnify:CR=1 FL=1